MNRGIYIQFIEDEQFQEKLFWNEQSELFKFLRNHTLKIELKYDIKFNSYADNEIPEDAIKMLVDEIRNDLDFLIEEYENNRVQNGGNCIVLNYNNKSFKLYYKTSTLHLMILDLIRFLDKLEKVLQRDMKIFVCGNANFNETMLQSLKKIRTNYQAKSEIDTSDIEEKVLADLISNRSLKRLGNSYEITKKGLIIEIPE